MTSHGKTIFTLDIGSTAVRLLAGRALPEGRIQVLHVSEVALPSLAQHAVHSPASLREAVERLAGRAMRETDEKIHELWLAMPSHAVQFVRSFGEAFSEKSVAPALLMRDALENATLPYLTPSQRVIHHWIHQSSLDERPLQKSLYDGSGRHLKVEVLLAVCSNRELRRRMEIVEAAGFKTRGVLVDVLASASATLSSKEVCEGVVLMDLGARKTTVGVWRDALLRDAFSIEMGGTSLTEDLASSLRIPLEDARRIQEQEYCACVPYLESKPTLHVELDSGEVRHVTPLAVAQILEPRVNELLAEITHQLAARAQLDRIHTVVFTGGCAWMGGFRELAEAHFAGFGWETRLGIPQGVSLGGELVSQTQYSTVLGLLREASAEKADTKFYTLEEEGVRSHLGQWISKFLDRFF